MRPFRRLFRLARLIAHIFAGILHAITRLPATPPPRTEPEWATVRNWHRKALRILGVEARIHGTPVSGPVLFVSNHISWLDIIALLTVIDAGFIGKQELASWPVLGFLISRGGTIYIERGGRDAAARTAAEMARRLERGERVAVFPEGTTTRGSDMRRFHPRLFEAAREAGVPIQPVAIRYDNPAAPFVDDDPFVTHLWRILGERRIGVDISLLEPIEARAHDRRSLARTSEDRIGAIVRGRPASTHPAPATAEG